MDFRVLREHGVELRLGLADEQEAKAEAEEVGVLESSDEK